MSKILEILFQSKARVKLLKFLFRNQNGGYTTREIAKIIRERPDKVRKEIKNLVKIKLILKK